MNGWTMEYVRSLDRDVRDVLIDEIKEYNKDQTKDTDMMHG